MKKKVLFLDLSLFEGGAEKYLKDYICEFNKDYKDRLEIFVACNEKTRYPIDENRFNKLVVGSLFKGNFIRNWFSFVWNIWKLNEYIKSHNIEIVVSNSVRSHFLAYFLNAKLFYIMHEVILSRWVFRFISKKASGIIYISNFVQNYYSKYGSSESGLIVRNSIDLKEYLKVNGESESNKIEQYFDLSENNKIIGMVGYFYPWKGQMEYIKLAERFLSRHAGYNFVIVGGYQEHNLSSKKYYKKCIKYISDNNLDKKIILTGNVDDAKQWIINFDVLVHTSLKPEPFGRVALEAIALGVPVISSNTGGVTEIVPSEYQIEPTDYDLRESKILEIIQNKPKFEVDLDLYKIDVNTKDFYNFLNR